jgi:protein-tyrosine-phosphatase
MGETTRVLFLCTGNSARSQMAEALLRHIGGGHFDVFSAGTTPRASVHPQAIETLRRNHVPIDGLRPKAVSTFAGQQFDYVITVCDRAREQCPAMPGAEMIHWSFPDPAQDADADAATHARAFAEVFHGLERRLRLLIVVSERPDADRHRNDS